MAKVVVYSSRTGRIRRIISDDVLSDEDLLDRHPVGVGESAELDLFSDTLEDLQAELSALTGLTPTNDRYVAILPSGDVVQILIADPDAGDSIVGATLVAHATANFGWRQRLDGSFERSLFDIDLNIKQQQNKRDKSYGSSFFIGKTPAEATAEIAANVAAANAALGLLTAERAQRAAPRS